MNKIIVFENYEYVLKYLIRNNIYFDKIIKSDSNTIVYLNNQELEKIPFKYKILRNKTIIFLLNQVLENKFLFISIIIFILSIIIVNNIILKVEVIHSSKDIRLLVKNELKNEGIHAFTIKSKKNNIDTIKKKIINQNNNKIEWMEIINNGVVYKVKIQERIKSEEVIIENKCDIISTKNSFITRYYLKNGFLNVDVNDYVNKGDILISGEIMHNDEIIKSVCADGDVYGSSWYLIKGKIPLIREEKNYLNIKKFNLSYNYGSNYNYLFKNHYELYDRDKHRLFKLFGLTVYLEVIKPYTLLDKKYTENDAVTTLKSIMKNKLITKIGINSKIIDEKVLLIKKENSIIELEIFYNVEEKISKKRIISE